MAVPNWGSLQKSQVDSETVEEAIARIIAEHEADEAAHLGAGESLQSHKASEIIDHAALSIINDKIADGSVTGDKITAEQITGKDFRTAADVGEEVDGVLFNSGGIEMWQSGEKKVDIPVSGNPVFKGNLSLRSLSYQRRTLYFPLDTVAAYSTTLPAGAGLTAEISDILMSTGESVGDVSELYLAETEIQPTIAKNPSLQFAMRTKNITTHDSYVLCGGLDPFGSHTYEYFGFKTVHTQSTKIYAVVRTSSSSETVVELTGINPTSWHVYKVETDDGGGTFKFYVDGVLITTIDPSTTIVFQKTFFYAAAKNYESDPYTAMALADIVFQCDY